MAGPWIPALYKILLQPQAIHQGKIMKEADLARKMKLLGKEMILGGKKSCFYRNCFIILFSDESCVQICFYDFERRKGKMFQVNPNLE